MNTYVVLLRGLTPTGKNKVLMAPLREALEKAGLEDVRSYIQSGNVIARSHLDRPAVESLVHDVIADTTGGDVAVLARTAEEFRQILERNPFSGADSSRLYFTLLSTAPRADLVDAFLTPGYDPDQVSVVGDVVYLLCATKYSDVKPNNTFVERKLKVTGTTRNLNTMSRLVDLSTGA